MSSGLSQRIDSSIACGMSERSASQRVELVGVGEQPVEEAAGGAVRGLGAGREQQAQEREDLLVAEHLAVELGLHQLADEVGRRGSSRRSSMNAGEVVAQLLARGDALLRAAPRR